MSEDKFDELDERVRVKKRRVRKSGTGYVVGIPDSWIGLREWLKGAVVVELKDGFIEIRPEEEA